MSLQSIETKDEHQAVSKLSLEEREMSIDELAELVIQQQEGTRGTALTEYFLNFWLQLLLECDDFQCMNFCLNLYLSKIQNAACWMIVTQFMNRLKNLAQFQGKVPATLQNQHEKVKKQLSSFEQLETMRSSPKGKLWDILVDTRSMTDTVRVIFTPLYCDVWSFPIASRFDKFSKEDRETAIGLVSTSKKACQQIVCSAAYRTWNESNDLVKLALIAEEQGFKEGSQKVAIAAITIISWWRWCFERIFWGNTPSPGEKLTAEQASQIVHLIPDKAGQMFKQIGENVWRQKKNLEWLVKFAVEGHCVDAAKLALNLLTKGQDQYSERFVRNSIEEIDKAFSQTKELSIHFCRCLKKNGLYVDYIQYWNHMQAFTQAGNIPTALNRFAYFKGISPEQFKGSSSLLALNQKIFSNQPQTRSSASISCS